MKNFKPFRLLLISLLLSFSSSVFAMSLSDAMSQLSSAKQQGLVGEQTNGYLGVVKNQNNATTIVNLINNARKQQYQKMAASHKVKLNEIEALAGKKAIQKTAAGLYIKVDGRWMKKP